MRRQTPVRRSGSFVGILILLAILGLFAAWGHEWWGPMRAEWGDHGGDDFFNMFGRPQHDQDQQVLNTQIPANAVVEIQNPRGDVSVTCRRHAHHPGAGAPGGLCRFRWPMRSKIFDSEAAHVTVSGNTVLVKSEATTAAALI